MQVKAFTPCQEWDKGNYPARARPEADDDPGAGVDPWRGVGIRGSRRDPDRLLPGDAIDFWRVESLEENEHLQLRAEMKLPGKA